MSLFFSVRHSVQLSLLVSCMALLVLSGCSRSGPAPTATPIPRDPVPTFTPTPEGQAVVAPIAGDQGAAAQVAVIPTQPPAQELPPTPEPPTPEPAPPTDTPVPQTARITITNDVANIRQGPSTAFGLVGSVTQGMSFDVVGKNQAGDWLLFCCVNGQEGWIFASLVQLDNPQLVAVAQNIPAPPALPTATPAPPPPTPAPAAPAPQPVGNPCPAMDRCTFRIRNGPKTFDNGGGEVKLTLAFIHSGVDGGQAQGSYFVVLKKDGVNLGVPDSVRSWTGAKRQGPGGAYNYEYKIGRDRLPGNNISGGYEIWVLDGNANQASPPYGFSIPDNQGEVWIEFDQG